MCKGLKPLLNEDIFRLSPPQPKSNNCHPLIEASSLTFSQSNLNASGGPSNQDASKAKWPCPRCTYLNWPRTKRCVQCYTKRFEDDCDMETVISTTGATTTATTTQINNTTMSNTIRDQMKNLTIGELGSDGGGGGGGGPIVTTGSDSDLAGNALVTGKGQSCRLSPVGSVNNLASSKCLTGAVSNRISPIESRPFVNKWACNRCTYENWPKSLKCSMCGNLKEHNNDIVDRCSANNTKLFPEKDLNEENSTTVTSNNTLSNNNNINNKRSSTNRYQLGSSDTTNCDSIQERQERRIRQVRRQVDWQWLNACVGVVENNFSAVEAYLSCGGNPGRALTSSEIAILNRNSAFDVGHTLIHLAIRFHRDEMLPMLLAQISGSGPGIKRVPSYIAPDLASDIRRHFANSLRIRKSPFNCHYIHEHATFALPAEIEELPIPIQEQLYDELLDRDAQKQLENPPPALNWSLEITARLGSRLMVLWNRSAGDCLLDSAMQATWGVFDRDNTLRRALSDSLHQCGHVFYPRWKEYEMIQAALLHFTLEETQWEEDWSTLLSLASQPGSSLEQLHIFALAHILRRPIIVYGVKYVKSFRGEDIGYARFEGLYLPLLWEQSFCIKSPIALGYTRGHFSALVPTEPYSRIEASRDDTEDVTFLPLMDCEMKLLPIHFLTQAEMGREEAIMRQWLDVCMTEGGILVAQQKLRKRPLLVAQMLEEWLNHYRRIAQVISAPFGRRPQLTGYSSDGDTDEE